MNAIELPGGFMFCNDCLVNVLACINRRPSPVCRAAHNQCICVYAARIANEFHYANLSRFIHIFCSLRHFCIHRCIGSCDGNAVVHRVHSISLRRICRSSMKFQSLNWNWNCIWWCFEVYCLGTLFKGFSIQLIAWSPVLISRWYMQTICKRYRFIDKIYIFQLMVHVNFVIACEMESEANWKIGDIVRCDWRHKNNLKIK